MNRRKQLENERAQKSADLAQVQAELNDPQTPASRIPALTNRELQLQRRISEIDQELANLPAADDVAVAGAVAAKKRAPRKRAPRKRPPQ
ncbi:MAG: hypothetical protein JST93_36560 [Acidobacteria bacterium]|nr:hypothetical protein [Acidobacteriota bacterium]